MSQKMAPKVYIKNSYDCKMQSHKSEQVVKQRICLVPLAVMLNTLGKELLEKFCENTLIPKNPV